MTNQNTNTGGITFVGALGLLFLGLKLAHVISWSWWLVTLPFYGALALFVAGSVLILLAAGATEAVKVVKRHRQITRLRANPAAGSGRRMSINQRRDGGR